MSTIRLVMVYKHLECQGPLKVQWRQKLRERLLERILAELKQRAERALAEVE